MQGVEIWTHLESCQIRNNKFWYHFRNQVKLSMFVHYSWRYWHTTCNDRYSTYFTSLNVYISNRQITASSWSESESTWSVTGKMPLTKKIGWNTNKSLYPHRALNHLYLKLEVGWKEGSHFALIATLRNDLQQWIFLQKQLCKILRGPKSFSVRGGGWDGGRDGYIFRILRVNLMSQICGPQCFTWLNNL